MGAIGWRMRLGAVIFLLVVLAAGCVHPAKVIAPASQPVVVTTPLPGEHATITPRRDETDPSSPLATPSLNASEPLTHSIQATTTTPISQTPEVTLPPVVLPTPTPKPTQQAISLPTPTPEPTIVTPPLLLPTPSGVVESVRVPILMYHYLSAPPPDADIYRQDLSVTPELFAAHLDRIQAEGYQTISLYDLLLHLTQGAPLPEKPVVITFDDGYRDNYENAFPLLKERSMTATFFVITDFIDEERPAYLTWEMVREMYAAGMDIESHGRNHVSLKGKDNDYLVWQALGSLETIAYEIGERPRFISYPAGEYDPAVIDIFRSADYWAGLTTQQGATHSLDAPFEWKRVRVRGTTTPDDLINLLALDW